MTTITGLIDAAKLATPGVSSLDLKFDELDIADVAYHGKLTLRRTYNHEYAWGCFVRLYRADDRLLYSVGAAAAIDILAKLPQLRQRFHSAVQWMLSAYEDDPGVALDLLKNEMFKWAREREAEKQP